MAPKLTPEEIVTLQVLKAKGQSQTQIAQTLGITEGAVRYPLRRQGQQDGPKNKPRKAAPLAQAIDPWVVQHHPGAQGGNPDRPIKVQLLYNWPRAEHGYAGSYKSVLRFGRARYPRPRCGRSGASRRRLGCRRKWTGVSFAGIDVGDGPQVLYGFVLVLSHSRKEVLIWCRRMDQLAWHQAHTEAFRCLGGLPAVLRIDNLKTGVVRGAGPWGQVNDAYRSYARTLGFHIDACLLRCPEDEGKVENKVGNRNR